ncbi:MAG: Uma2 family endonuclease [Firmicutes bacterium]|nr:Uma2 family endonuclease [Bacillota bacterium]
MDALFEDFITTMSNKPRHGRLVSGFVGGIFTQHDTLIRQGNLEIFHENIRLCYLGNLILDFDGLRLYDLDNENYHEEEYDVAEYVMPDFLLFHENKFIEQNSQLYGSPDLIVEVWSKGNTKLHRKFKQHLYSKSPKTEHWYLTQDSNQVERYLGDKKLEDLSLLNPLRTQNGIEFDLTYLAI